jgi:hypothetical protein
MKPAPHTNDFATRDDIADVRADIAALRALVEQALSIIPPRTWLTVDEAAQIADFSPQAIRGWCRAYRIGTCVRGQWQVDRAQLRAHIVARFGASRLPPELR